MRETSSKFGPIREDRQQINVIEDGESVTFWKNDNPAAWIHAENEAASIDFAEIHHNHE